MKDRAARSSQTKLAQYFKPASKQLNSITYKFHVISPYFTRFFLCFNVQAEAITQAQVASSVGAHDSMKRCAAAAVVHQISSSHSL